MAPKLHFFETSTASRATLLAIKALGVDVDYAPVNLMAGEHLRPEYLKINPAHTVPTLTDDDVTISDSHAINAYLADRYASDDALYPKNLEKRALVDQMLFFDTGAVFPKLVAVLAPLLGGQAKSLAKDKIDALIDVYQVFEAILEGKNYAAGDDLSIADFSLVATLSTCNVLVPIASNRFPRMTEWFGRLQQLPYYHNANQAGVDKVAAFLKGVLA